MSDNQTLLIDGYISQTFRSLAAEKYFLNLLKSTNIPAHATSSNTEKEDYFFVYSQIVPPHMLARTPNPPDRWLLDRGVADGGTVIPQTMWSPRSAADKRQHVETAELLMPVFFENNLKDEGPGLSLRTCINGRCRVLGNPTVPAPVGQKTTTHIRIVWPGYKEFKRQISLYDESKARSPITMAKFAMRVGRTVDYFFRFCELDSTSIDERRELWRIGPGGIQRSDIMIIGAVHVSAGSWMPIMQLNRYIF